MSDFYLLVFQFAYSSHLALLRAECLLHFFYPPPRRLVYRMLDFVINSVPICLGGADVARTRAFFTIATPAVAADGVETTVSSRSRHAKRRACEFVNSMMLAVDTHAVSFYFHYLKLLMNEARLGPPFSCPRGHSRARLSRRTSSNSERERSCSSGAGSTRATSRTRRARAASSRCTRSGR